MTANKPKTNLDQWERELREAGWKPYRFRGRERRTMWVALDGSIHRGPYGAWRMMQSLRQWSCDSPFHPGCSKCEVPQDPHDPDCPCYGDYTAEGQRVIHDKKCANCTCAAKE